MKRKFGLQRRADRLAMKKALRRGQVTKDTKIGHWITFLSSLPETKTILDIETWSGSGTTLCIANGVKSRRDLGVDSVEVIGLELNRELAFMAAKRLKDFPFVSVVYGTLVSAHELDQDSLSAEERVWLANDLEMMSEAPVVIEDIPLSLDLVILDGGEFSTYSEFVLLKNRLVKWLVLDDVRVRKNKRVFEELQCDPKFVLVDEDNERNGVAIFMRVES